MSEYYNIPPHTTPLTNYVIVTTEVPVVTVNNSDVVGVAGVVVRSIPVINQPIQVGRFNLIVFELIFNCDFCVGVPANIYPSLSDPHKLCNNS